MLTAKRELVAKVKIKEDKFNVYDSSEARTTYGKFKNGRISVRSDSGSEIASLSVTNSPSLKQVSPLALPIPDQFRAMLYLSFLYSEEQF